MKGRIYFLWSLRKYRIVYLSYLLNIILSIKNIKIIVKNKDKDKYKYL